MPTASDSNPPSPWGEGLLQLYAYIDAQLFQSTLPVRGGTTDGKGPGCDGGISIHPPRVGRDALQPGKLLFRPISIHPPRKGRDLLLATQSLRPLYFNPPSPQGEGLGLHREEMSGVYFNPPSPQGEGPAIMAIAASTAQFQSTLPARGGTTLIPGPPTTAPYFNPPSPRGEGPKPGHGPGRQI